MSKRAPEEIIHSVERYQRGETSQGAEAKRLGVSKRTFQDWVRKYETFGGDGFRRTENRRYSKELKLSAVQAYLNGEGSHAAICKRYGILSRTQLQNWIKAYNGHKELRLSRGQGSDIYMTKGRTTTYEERIEIVSYCIEHGNNYTATIEMYGVSYQQIYSWVMKYTEKGAEGLEDKRGKRKAESEMIEVEKLRTEKPAAGSPKQKIGNGECSAKKTEKIERLTIKSQA